MNLDFYNPMDLRGLLQGQLYIYIYLQLGLLGEEYKFIINF
jgi:hypothetical protein